MYFHWRLIILITLLIACNPSDSPDKVSEKVPIDKNLQVIINYALSSKIDLMKGDYTVYFISKPPFEAKFELTPIEKEQIIIKYYSLALYELNEVDANWGTIYIEDECMIMPKIYTYLTVERDGGTQQIQIDESCDEYSWGKSNRARRVKTFLQFVDGIISAKPEIKNAPKSDIWYI